MRLLNAKALTFVLIIGAGLAWLAGTWAWAAYRESRALGAWVALGRALDETPPTPKKDANAAALALEKAAEPLGIRLRSLAGPGAVEPEPPGMDREAKTDWGRIRLALTKWVTNEAERPEANVEPPPAEVGAWLAGHSAELDAIESALVTGPAPEWAEDPSLLFAAPAPSTAGHLQLHVVVLGRALARASAGDAAAERSLLASWNFAAPQRLRADVPSRTIASLATHLQLGVLRKLSVNPDPWRARIAAWNPRESVQRSWEREAWTTWRAGRRLRAPVAQGIFARLLAGPARRLEAAAFLDGWRSMTEAARRSPVSDGDGSAIAAAFRTGMGRWADAAPPIPNLASAWKRADRLLLEAELTSKVFDVRAAREASGAWAAAVPGIEASKGTNVTWVYAVTPEGRASLVTNRTLTWPDRATSPLGWVSEPPAGAKAPAAKSPSPKSR